jgi:hypothetical protein
MDREHVNLIGSDEPVDNTVRKMNYLANQWDCRIPERPDRTPETRSTDRLRRNS